MKRLVALMVLGLLVLAPQAAAQEYQLPLPNLPSSPNTPTATALTYLNPFPVVRLAGRMTSTGVSVRLLQVRSPRNSSVTLRCRGGRRRGCRFRSKTRRSPASRLVRFPEIRRRLRAGVVLEVFVRRGTTIGKYTRFRIRRARYLRSDSCLLPGRARPVECPE
jgi:hypothetical protein